VRVEKLDEDEIAGLRAKGFVIDKQSEAATMRASLTEGDLTIGVFRPEKVDKFLVYIELPNGTTLVCHASRAAITVRDDED
jgi:hypothetical protein